MLPSYATANLQSAAYRLAAQQRATRPAPRLTDSFDTLFALAEACAELRRRRLYVAAKTVKETTISIIEQWLDGDMDRDTAREQLAALLSAAQDSIGDDEITNSEQIAAARAHVSATLAWALADDWDVPATLSGGTDEHIDPDECVRCQSPCRFGSLLCVACENEPDDDRLCAGCEVPHHTAQHCPDVFARLMAVWVCSECGAPVSRDQPLCMDCVVKAAKQAELDAVLAQMPGYAMALLDAAPGGIGQLVAYGSTDEAWGVPI